jgi:hypothetical protein
MARRTDIVLIIGSGPNAIQSRDWRRDCFDRIVAINNAWRVRPDWDDLIYPEDFPEDRRPTARGPTQRVIEADQFVPTQNAYGGFVYAGGTMAFTAGYWALHALRPKVLAYMGCDMVYPTSGPTHFYGTGSADPLRADVTLHDLGAKSARLGLLAAAQGCHCVNLSRDPSALLFTRAEPGDLRGLATGSARAVRIEYITDREDRLGYFVPNGRYWEHATRFDPQALAELDAQWLIAWAAQTARVNAA